MLTSDINVVPRGTACPDFCLRRVDTGELVTPSSLRRGVDGEFKGLVVMFICNHCPLVGGLRPAIAVLAETYLERGVAFLAIQPNETSITPMNGPTEMRGEIATFGYAFPYCFDGDVQSTSRAFGAVVTPDFFVYDAQLRLVYRGDFDGSRPTPQGQFAPPKPVEQLFTAPGKRIGGAVDGRYVRAACDALVSGDAKRIENIPEHISEGCSIKWLRDANEPSYSRSEYDNPGGLAGHTAWNRRYRRWALGYDLLYFFLGFVGIKRPCIANQLTPGGI